MLSVYYCISLFFLTFLFMCHCILLLFKKMCCNHIFILPRLKNHPCYYKTFKYSPKTKPIEKAPELVHELLVIVIISLAQNVHIIKTNPYCSNVYPVLMFIYNKLPFIGPWRSGLLLLEAGWRSPCFSVCWWDSTYKWYCCKSAWSVWQRLWWLSLLHCICWILIIQSNTSMAC